MADNEVSFLVKLKDEFSNGINKVIKGFTGLDAATAKSQVGTTALGVAFGNLAAQAVGLALNGVKQLGSFMLDCVYANAEAERATNALAASLQSVGITSQYVLNDLKNYAGEMQTISGISDEVFQDGMRLLTNFGLVGDELKRATASAYNLSLGLNMDLKSAFQLVARGAEGNLTMFSRYGITVDSTKSKSEQFAEVLDKVDTKFGQLAGANANNLITRTNLLKETWGDFKEEVGAAVGGAGGGVDILLWGVERLRDGLKILQNYYARLSEEIIIGAKQFGLMYDGIVYGAQVSKLAVLELGNALKLVSDESVENAKKSVASAKAQMNMTSQQIDLLESQKTAVFDLSSAKHEASEAEIAEAKKQQEQAKANFEAQKQMEEARKKSEENAKKRAEQDARDAENRAKRVSDFKFQTHMDYLDKIAEIEKAQTGYEQAELIARNEQDYQAKRTALENQIAYLAEKNSNDINAKMELQGELQALEEEWAAYEAELAQRKQDGAIAYNALDKFLADERTQNAMKSLNDISQLQNAKTKELAAVGKAAAIATATVDTYKAANAAYSAMAGIPIVGPALGAAAAAAAIATGLMNVGKITGIQLAVGTPYVPQDMPATVHQGEIIVPRTFSEGLRAGDLALASPDVLSGAEGGGQYNVVQNFNFNGDVLADSADSIAEKLGQKTSELIAGGRMAPFPTGERM